METIINRWEITTMDVVFNDSKCNRCKKDFEIWEEIFFQYTDKLVYWWKCKKCFTKNKNFKTIVKRYWEHNPVISWISKYDLQYN